MRTGMDLARLIDAANWPAEEVGAPSKGFVRHTGPVPAPGRRGKPLPFTR
ncbi:hypothetical protein [Streptomyces sp. NPDC094472]